MEEFYIAVSNYDMLQYRNSLLITKALACFCITLIPLYL